MCCRRWVVSHIGWQIGVGNYLANARRIEIGEKGAIALEPIGLDAEEWRHPLAVENNDSHAIETGRSKRLHVIQRITLIPREVNRWSR